MALWWNADTLVLGTSAERREGASPSRATNLWECRPTAESADLKSV